MERPTTTGAMVSVANERMNPSFWISSVVGSGRLEMMADSAIKIPTNICEPRAESTMTADQAMAGQNPHGFAGVITSAFCSVVPATSNGGARTGGMSGGEA